MPEEREDFIAMMKKREELIQMGVNPYPHKYEITHSVPEIVRDNATNIVYKGDLSTAGRVFAIRRHGKSTFVDIVDEGVRLQIYLKADVLGDKYRFFLKYVRRGDFIGVRGELFRTKTGELTLLVKDFTILCKALYTLPREWYGLKDIRERYKRRYLDLLLNERVRRTFILRSRIISEIRRYLEERGFIEVETPIIQPVYGGAAARPFTTYVNALGENRYLRISPELYLKRLIIGGLNKVFEIGKNFRNEDIDALHNPEFTSLEVYEAYADYNDMMRLTEDMISTVAKRVLGTTKIKCPIYTEEGEMKEVEIDLSPPWRRIKMYDAIKMYTPHHLDVREATDEELMEELEKLGITLRGGYNRGLAIEKIFEAYCEKHLIRPTFVMDYPKETSPLCKPHREDPTLIERFEAFIAGMEIANAYTELNDPVLQEQFFMEQQERKMRGDVEAHEYDEEFVEALRYGMPPTGGLGIGIDRLVMILTGCPSIKEVILFPMLRREE